MASIFRFSFLFHRLSRFCCFPGPFTACADTDGFWLQFYAIRDGQICKGQFVVWTFAFITWHSSVLYFDCRTQHDFWLCHMMVCIVTAYGRGHHDISQRNIFLYFFFESFYFSQQKNHVSNRFTFFIFLSGMSWTNAANYHTLLNLTRQTVVCE